MAKEQLEIILNDDGSFKKYAGDTAGAARQTDNLTKSAIKLGLAYVSLESARAGFDLSEEAAKAQDVQKAYNNLAANAGIVGDQMLASMKEATAGTIAEFELMQQFGSASLLGLPLDRFDEMLDIARGASKATGQTMEFMLNSIVTGIGRSSKLMLDNLGIIIDVKKANEEYAESLGKVSSELTDAEKKQAFSNKALEIGNANLERIGDLGESSADTFAELTSESSNLAIAIGEKLLPVFEPLAQAAIDSAKGIQAMLESTDVNPIIAMNQNLLQTQLRLQEVTAQYSEHSEELVIAKENQKLAEDVLVSYIATQRDAFESSIVLTEENREQGKTWKDLAKEIDDAAEAGQFYSMTLPDISEASAETARRIKEVTDALTEQDQAFLDAIDLANQFVSTVADVSDAITDIELEAIRQREENQVEGIDDEHQRRLDAIKSAEADNIARAKATIKDGKKLSAAIRTIEKETREATVAERRKTNEALDEVRDEADDARADARKAQKPFLIAETIANGTAGAIKAFIDPGGKAGAALAALIGVSTIAAVATIASQKFARGGITPGGPVTMNEEGPEDVVLPKGSRIFSASQTRQNMAQGNGDIVLILNDIEVARAIAPPLQQLSIDGENDLALNTAQ